MRTHQMTSTPEYGIWCGIIQRCTNPKRHNYRWYGGAGVTICAEWLHSFEAFYAHVGPRPTPKHSIDRIKTRLGYQPGNVKWATVVEQRRNMTSNRMVTAFGKTQTSHGVGRREGAQPHHAKLSSP